MTNENLTLANHFINKYYFTTLIDDLGNRTVIFKQNRDEPYRILNAHYVMAMAINYKSYYSNMTHDQQTEIVKYIERIILYERL